MNSPSLSIFVVLSCAVAFTGCRTVAPMNVYRIPAIPSSDGRVAIAPVAGTGETPSKIANAMLVQVPIGSIAALGPQELQTKSAIQLASFDSQPSEIASVSAARNAGCKVLLVGEVVKDELVPASQPKSTPRSKEKIQTERLTVAWRAIDVPSGAVKKLVSIDRLQAEETYPDLLQLSGDGADRVIAAVARQSWSLVSPVVEEDRAPLAKPTFGRSMFGVYRGNRLAKQGRWDLAEIEWQDVVTRYGKDKSAWHNLSMAAVAHEDFDLARSRLRHAESWMPYSLDESSLVWLERRQRDYHNAFQLPPPRDGWTLPDPPKITHPSQLPPTLSTSLNAMFR
jgi:hypothetical protein